MVSVLWLCMLITAACKRNLMEIKTQTWHFIKWKDGQEMVGWNFVIIHAEQPKTKNNNKQIRQWRELWKHLKRLQARFERNRCRKCVKGIKHETVNKCTRSYATFNKQRRDCKRWNSTTACGRSTCSIKVLKYILCTKPSPQFDYASFPHKANSLKKWHWNTMTLMTLNRLLEKDLCYPLNIPYRSRNFESQWFRLLQTIIAHEL